MIICGNIQTYMQPQSLNSSSPSSPYVEQAIHPLKLCLLHPSWRNCPKPHLSVTPKAMTSTLISVLPTIQVAMDMVLLLKFYWELPLLDDEIRSIYFHFSWNGIHIKLHPTRFTYNDNPTIFLKPPTMRTFYNTNNREVVQLASLFPLLGTSAPITPIKNSSKWNIT